MCYTIYVRKNLVRLPTIVSLQGKLVDASSTMLYYKNTKENVFLPAEKRRQDEREYSFE